MSRRFPPDRQRARARDTREFGAPRGRALNRRSSDFWATIRRRFAPLAGGTNLRELEIGLPGVHKGAVLNGLGIKSPLTAADADPTGRSLVAACSAWVPGTQVGDRRPGGRIFSSDSALACRCPVHTVYSLSPQLTRPGSASASPRAPLRPSPTGSTGVVQGRGSSTNPSSWRARNRARASGFRRAARHAGRRDRVGRSSTRASSRPVRTSCRRQSAANALIVVPAQSPEGLPRPARSGSRHVMCRGRATC